jgi:hypothetical protein
MTVQWEVWKITGDKAAVFSDPGSRIAAECAAITLNAHAPAGTRYEALPLGGSPFDAIGARP